MVNDGLVQQPVDNEGVVPVLLVAAVLVVAGDVIEIAIPRAEKPAAEAAGPCLLAMRIPDYRIGVWTCCAAVGVLVVLVKGIGAPEDAVAIRARIPLVPLVEFFLVALPVELALEGDIAKGAPVGALGFGRPSIVALRGNGRRRQRGGGRRRGRL